jgi:HlyD family secretion protein
MNSSIAEILDGLSPGDLVVIHPSDTLQEGSLAERRQQGT